MSLLHGFLEYHRYQCATIITSLQGLLKLSYRSTKKKNVEAMLGGYKLGFELLVMNDALTFIGLLSISQKR